MDTFDRMTGPTAPHRVTLERLRSGLGREVLSFAAVGVVSTAAYAVLYLTLRMVTGSVAANAIALVATAIGNTAANRRLTFGVRDRVSIVRHQAAGLVALTVALTITTASVGVLTLLAPGASRLVELAVLVAANALATAARFVLLRASIVGIRRDLTHSPAESFDGSPS